MSESSRLPEYENYALRAVAELVEFHKGLAVRLSQEMEATTALTGVVTELEAEIKRLRTVTDEMVERAWRASERTCVGDPPPTRRELRAVLEAALSPEIESR